MVGIDGLAELRALPASAQLLVRTSKPDDFTERMMGRMGIALAGSSDPLLSRNLLGVGRVAELVEGNPAVLPVAPTVSPESGLCHGLDRQTSATTPTKKAGE